MSDAVSVRSDVTPEALRDSLGPAGTRATVSAIAAALALLAGILLLLAWRFPRFFFVDDRIVQYLPMYRWMGERLSRGELPPLNVPQMGMAGNLSADIQYGVLDPAHWLFSLLVYWSGDLNVGSWALSSLALSVMATATVLLLRTYSVSALWSVVGAVAAATSGCIMYVGGAWWPLMWATSLLPLLWLALRCPSWGGVVMTALASWLVSGSGYPYVLPFAAAIVICQLVAFFRREDTRRDGWRKVSPLLLGGIAGALASAPGILTAVASSSVTFRSGTLPPGVGNAGLTVPNLGDVLFGSPTLLPISVLWQSVSDITVVPIMASLPGVLGLAALIRWRSAVRLEGTVIALGLLGLSALLSQMPDDAFGFRVAFRYLADVQLFLCIALALGARAGYRLTRPRLLFAGSMLTLTAVIAIFRTPNLTQWHVVGIALCVAFVAGVVLYSSRSAARPLGAVLAVVAVAASPLAGLAVASSAAARAGVTPAGFPAAPVQSVPIGYIWDSEPAAYRDRALSVDDDTTLIRWGNSPDFGWDSGVFAGNANLNAGVLPGFGYTSVGHRQWADRWCQNYLGAVGVCTYFFDRTSSGNDDRTVDSLLEEEPSTGESWIDLMVGSRVALSPETPDRVIAHFVSNWTEGETNRGWRVFERPAVPTPLSWTGPGVRATAAAGDETLSVSTTGRGRVTLSGPWWPGYVAHIDGVEVPVTSIDGTVPVVDLPAGLSDAELTIEYSPWPSRLLLPAAAGAVVVTILGVLLATVTRRRRAIPAQHPSRP